MKTEELTNYLVINHQLIYVNYVDEVSGVDLKYHQCSFTKIPFPKLTNSYGFNMLSSTNTQQNKKQIGEMN